MLNYKVESIDARQTYEWLLKKHYAKRIPNIIYSFGLYKDRLLCGVITFGNPPNPNLCSGICGEEYRNLVLELNRLVINEGEEKNALSFFVSKSLSLIKGEKIIVSYADTSQGHHGYIYQATNWIYTGLSAKRTDPIHDAKNVHNRNSFVKGLPQKERPRKHRYLYFLGAKKKIKTMKSQLKYPILPYPKGENKRYDASYKPHIQSKMF